MKYYLERADIEFRADEAALRSFERAEARGEILETRGFLEVYVPGLVLLLMRLAIAERE